MSAGTLINFTRMAMNPIAHSQIDTRQARIEGLILAVVATALTVPFWLTDLDIWAAGVFFHPGNAQNFWPEEQRGLWLVLYKAIPILANALLLGCLGVLAFYGDRANAKRIRRMALFVLFSIILGPGLVVNGIFKDHYGRPRPRQIEQFQGHLTYQPPGMPGSEGKSFPCGHCSVGYLVCVFYFLTRRKKPLLAGGLLVFAIVLGVLVGVGRMAAGGHFLSDVFWSGIFTYAVCAVIYQPLVGRWEEKPDTEVTEFFLLDYWHNLSKPVRSWLFVGLAVVLSLAASLATPHKTERVLQVPLPGQQSGTALIIQADVGDVVIKRSAQVGGSAHIRLKFKGFGFPTSTVAGVYQPENQIFTLATTGLFTDIEGQLELTVPVDFQGLLHITAAKGAIVLPSGRSPQWHLQAAKGVFDDTATR